MICRHWRFVRCVLITSVSIGFAFVFTGVFISNAQEDALTPITADNVRDLVPVRQIAFEDGDFLTNTGWFALTDDGGMAATVRTDGGLVFWDLDTGEQIDTYTLTIGDADFPADVVDARFSADGERIAVLHTDGGQAFVIALYTIGSAGEDMTLLDYPDDAGIPVRVWWAEDESAIWLEATPDYFTPTDSQYRVVRLPLEAGEDVLIQPSAPEADTESFVRIGRITVPLAITSTADGLVKLWDIEEGAVLIDLQLDDTPVFGRINESTGRQFVWRDQISQGLHFLDFESGESRLVAEIDGAYVQALLLTVDNSAILGVHIGESPDVVAWMTGSGERVKTGQYWSACSRVPDMVRISTDGTTLVIGCDAGLDVWRVE